MIFKHGSFLIYKSSQIKNLKSFNEIFKLLDTEDIIDGIGPYPERISVLDTIITGVEGRTFQPVEHNISANPSWQA